MGVKVRKILSSVRRVTFSISLVLAAAALNYWLHPYISSADTLLYYPVVILAILWGSPIVAILGSVAAIQYFSAPAFSWELQWPADVIRQALFVLFAGTVTWLGRTRSKALAQLQFEKEKLDAIIRKVDVGIGLSDPQGNILSLNPAGLAIHGFSSEREMLERLESYAQEYELQDHDGKSLPLSQWPLSRALQGDYVSRAEVRLIHKATGVARYLLYSATPLLDRRGKVQNILFNISEITDRKLAELQAKKNERKLMGVLNATQESVWLFERDATVKMANEVALKRVGLTREQVFGRRFTEFIPEELARTRLAKIEEVYQTRKEVQFEDHRSGIDFYHSFSPVFGPGGEITTVISFSRDITERKRAERALKESESRFRNLADSMPQLVWTARSDGSVDYYNQRIHEYAGPAIVSGSEWLWQPLIHPDDLEKTVDAWSQAVRTGQIYSCEHRVCMKNGSYRWHLSRALPARDESGQVIQWFGTATDIEDLKEAIRARDEFLSVASHELKTPLTSLKLQAQMRQRIFQGVQEPWRDERLRRMFETDSRQFDRLTHLIDDMLDVARINTGCLDFHWETFDLSELVTEVVERHRPQFEAMGVQEIGCEQESIFGEWDRFRLEQVITNLLSNAAKYGGGKPIQVRLSREGGRLARLSVQDQGPGIARDHQSRIFQRFERATSSKAISGLGLGLYISRQITEGHGGRIWVESEPGRGSTFFLELPLSHRPGSA